MGTDLQELAVTAGAGAAKPSPTFGLGFPWPDERVRVDCDAREPHLPVDVFPAVFVHAVDAELARH